MGDPGQVEGWLRLSGLPMELRAVGASRFTRVDESGLFLHAPMRSDRFVDPASGAVVDDAPWVLGAVQGAFDLTARVTVDFRDVYDAGALVVRAGPHDWAKLCLELSAEREPRVVSVVTKMRSDDSNGFVASEKMVTLRVVGDGRAIGFHAQRSDGSWELVRHFALGPLDAPLEVGFGAQAPRGEGCDVRFDRIEFSTFAGSEVRVVD